MRARATTASERPGGHNAPWRIIVEGAVTGGARAHRCMRFADQLHAQTLELERSKYTADAIQAFYRSSSSGSCSGRGRALRRALRRALAVCVLASHDVCPLRRALRRDPLAAPLATHHLDALLQRVRAPAVPVSAADGCSVTQLIVTPELRERCAQSAITCVLHRQGEASS